MNKYNPHILELISNYLDKSISENQYNELKLWLEETPENRVFFIEYTRFYKKTRMISLVEKIDQEKAWNNVLAKFKEPIQFLKKNPSNVKYLKTIKQILKYAAVLVGTIGVSYFYLKQNNTPAIRESQLIIAEEAITLELEDGKVKVIDPKGKDNIIDKYGKVVGFQNGTELVYNDKTKKENLEYNTLTIPYGKQFKLRLSDGTNVHLNAGTSLKYPVKFIKGKNRQVYLLSGEAYFDVVKDVQHPFIVNSGEMNIRVLGTKFNVSAYPEEEAINTVLVEGTVSLYNMNTGFSKKKSLVLTPNYKATWNKLSNHTVIEQVEVDEYISWIEGRLVFRNLPFSKIIKKLERKYNVTIVNNNLELDNQFYDATFDIETIEEVLNSFNKSYAIDFSIENNKVIIN